VPRYFFNIVLGKIVQEDLNGRVLQDDMTARAYALQSARQALKEAGRKAPKLSECFVDVTDGLGTTLFRVPFSEMST
jgi:hypothetical protein